jgi:hypothetical protein
LLQVRQGLRHAAEAAAVAVLYVAVAKLSLRFASINPSATPIWPPTGLALALLVLRGYRCGRRFSSLPLSPISPPRGRR